MFTGKTEIEIAYGPVYARKTRNAWPDGDFDGGDDDFPNVENRCHKKMRVSLEKRYIYLSIISSFVAH